MSYITEVKDRLKAGLDDCPDELLLYYALLVLTVGEGCTLEDVHDAWSCWRETTRPDHPSLVPFDHLDSEVQLLDMKYRDVIRKVARSG